VFRAAVWALGSNNRAWATFLRNESQLAQLLGGYDPTHAHIAAQQGALTAEALKHYLPGQTAGGDANAILSWAKLLTESEDYYGFLCNLGRAFHRLAKDRNNSLQDNELLLCVAGYLGRPPSTWEGEKYLVSADHRVLPTRRKTPGMGYALASEFLRNLGWTGFKPDRHIKRLFDAWFPNGTEAVNERARYLARLIGYNDKDLWTYLAYSLLGARMAPPDIPLSHVDNLVWLLGAYVEKKGRESAHVYVMQ
jgi:hypothetical protein